MRLKLYQQETQKLSEKHKKILAEIHHQIEKNNELSAIEEQAALHSLQTTIENAIGKARHLLKSHNKKVPVSAYDLFEELKSQGFIQLQELNQWKKIIGLRNTIVHEYMKVNMEMVTNVILEKKYEFVLAFLNLPFEHFLGEN
jgi:uncharacterized protein YutE (UPF0331/DUF86 family)